MSKKKNKSNNSNNPLSFDRATLRRWTGLGELISENEIKSALSKFGNSGKTRYIQALYNRSTGKEKFLSWLKEYTSFKIDKTGQLHWQGERPDSSSTLLPKSALEHLSITARETHGKWDYKKVNELLEFYTSQLVGPPEHNRDRDRAIHRVQTLFEFATVSTRKKMIVWIEQSGVVTWSKTKNRLKINMKGKPWSKEDHKLLTAKPYWKLNPPKKRKPPTDSNIGSFGPCITLDPNTYQPIPNEKHKNKAKTSYTPVRKAELTTLPNDNLEEFGLSNAQLEEAKIFRQRLRKQDTDTLNDMWANRSKESLKIHELGVLFSVLRYRIEPGLPELSLKDALREPALRQQLNRQEWREESREKNSPKEAGFELLSEDTRDFHTPKVAKRSGQVSFKKALVERYGLKCMISGCSIPEVIEAAHITPYRGEKDNHVENGLLLRVDLHRLFDAGIIGINPETKTVQLSSSVPKEQYSDLKGLKLICVSSTSPSKEAMREAWTRFETLEISYSQKSAD